MARPNKDEYIVGFRKILKEAKDTFCSDNFNRDEYSEIYKTTLICFSFIGKGLFHELIPEVYQFLNCKNAIIRETAVTNLGLSTRLHVPEFRDVAYNIFLKDEEEIVKGPALRAWASYYHDTQDKTALKVLYKTLLDENCSINSRHSALIHVFHVSQEPSNMYDVYTKKDFYMINSHEEFNQKVDWEEIRAIIRKYAPEALQG